MQDYSGSPYYNTALSAAAQYGVPSSLFIAQIGQESGFNPNAQNGSATGIAQFMPATAAQYGVNSADPTSSLYGAAKYDATLYSQYGSWQTAMQKYGTTANGAAPNVDAMAASVDSPLGQFFNGIANGIGSATAGANAVTGAAANVGSTALSTAKGVGSLLAIVTDLPRMTTIIIGLILLIAGLFMLGVVPAVKLVTAAKTVGAKAGLTA